MREEVGAAGFGRAKEVPMGVLSTNAGGLRPVAIRSLRGSVLGLEVVLPNGISWISFAR